jgi:hypothetical protein
MFAMTLQPPVLNRLIAARHLIDSSGQELTSVSNPLAVSQKLLLAHDSAELVLCALKSQLNLKSDQTFMGMAKVVCDTAFPEPDGLAGSATDLLDQMNRLRVAFKHHGNFPDASSSFHLFSDVVRLLNAICSSLINTPLVEIDHATAIQLQLVKERFDNARSSIENGLYKKALESISLGLSAAFSNLNVPSRITPGYVLSEDALLLSGRGIDPANFLTMQGLLPYTPDGEEVVWWLRKNGHEGNWTKENAEFCLETAISAVVRLQTAQLIPVAQDFYDRYEDVVEIIVDHPTIYDLETIVGSDGAAELIGSVGKGERFIGKATGYLDRPIEYGEAAETSLERARYVALQFPRNRLLPEEVDFRTYLFGGLWFKKEEVEVSYQLREDAGKEALSSRIRIAPFETE